MEFLLARMFWAASVLIGGTYFLYQVARIDASWSVRGVIGAIAGALLCAALFGGYWYIERREIQLTTRLYPGDLSPPVPAGCAARVPPGAMVVFWGGNISWSNTMPRTIIKMHGEPFLVVDKKDDRLVVTRLTIFDDRGYAVAVADGEGTFETREGARRSRPDKSTLVVYDYAENEVLRLIYANPTTLVLTGTFRRRGSPTITMSEQQTMIGTYILSGNCSGAKIDVEVN